MLDRIDRNDVLNVVGAALAAYGGIAFLCFIYLVERWAHSAPTSPDPSRGLIYSHSEHGWITYFSAFQATSCALLFATSIPLSSVGIFVSPKRNVVYRRGFLSFGAKWDPNDPKGLQRIGFIIGAVAAPILIFIIGRVVVNTLIAAGAVISLG